MKVLSIEQMTRLKELGVDTSKASMAIYDIYAGGNKVYDIIASNGAFPEDQEYDRFGYGIHSAVAFCKKPVFTLQDIIELLPIENIDIRRNCHERWIMSYKDEITFKTEFMIDAAYLMLIWVIENGHLKTK